MEQQRTVTEAEVVAFAALTGEGHPLHTDVAYAARGEACCVAVAELPCGRQA